MFFIPLHTDAPIYHWPYSTVGMIVLNTLVFVATFGMASGQADAFILAYGNGWHPVQWVTSNFMHADILHLLFNMLFLWAFGIVIEGKVGWWRFLVIYFGIGVVQCAAEQTLMLGAHHGGSLGASSIIFGLMAISMVWAPMNGMTCLVAFVFYRVWVHTVEMPIWLVAVIFLFINVFFGVLYAVLGSMSFSLTSEILHLMGASLGFVVGVVLLQLRLVDCENWDMFSVWGNEGQPEEVDPYEELQQLGQQKDVGWSKQLPDAPVTPVELTPEATLGQIRSLMAMSQPTLALNLHQKLSREAQDWRLPEADHIRLIQVLHEREMWLPSIDLMIEYLRTHRLRQAHVRLKLAAVLVTHQQRPRQSLHVLSQLQESDLDRSEQQVFRSLVRKSQQMKLSTEFETQVEDW